MGFASGPKQQQSRGQGTAGDDDDIGGVSLLPSLAQHDGARHTPPSGIRVQALNIGVDKQCEVRVRGERGVDAHDLGIRFAVQQAWKPIECIATDARAGGAHLTIFLVEQDTQWQVERMQAQLLKFVG